MFLFSTFKLSLKTAFLLLILMIVPSLLFGQTGEFDWGSLGVNVTVVGGIISVTQFLKISFLKDLPGAAFLALNMALSGAAAYLMRDPAASVEATIQLVVFYMGASAYLYNIAKRTPGLANLFKDGKAAKNNKLQF